MGYNVARNLLGTVPNAPLASPLGKELYPPILSMLAMHGDQVKREIGLFHHHDYLYFLLFFFFGGYSEPHEDTQTQVSPGGESCILL